MKKNIIVTVALLAVVLTITGSMLIKVNAGNKKTTDNISISVDESLLRIVKELDPTVGEATIEEDDMSGCAGLVRFIGKKYKIYVDPELNVVRCVYDVAFRMDETVKWNASTALEKAKSYLALFANGNVKYDLKEELTQSYGMWEYSATEYKNDELTGTYFYIGFELSGDICAANFSVGKNIDKEKITAEQAIEIAKDNLCRYAKNDDIGELEATQSSIAGNIVWQVKSEKYYTTVDAVTGECLLVSKMK